MPNLFIVPPTTLAVQIYAIAAVVFLFVVIALHTRRLVNQLKLSVRGFYVIVLAAAGYFVGLGIFASHGAFLTFTPFPPRILLVVLTTLVAAMALLLWRGLRPLWHSIALQSIIGLQCFRFLAELLIFWLEREKAMPAVMTVAGRNYDILVPATALLMYLAMRNHGISAAGRRWLIAWNLFGIVVLLNTVATAVLSLPSPRQIFALGEALVTPAVFPFYLLPVFMVPLALSLHMLALLKLAGFYSRDTQPATASGIR